MYRILYHICMQKILPITKVRDDLPSIVADASSKLNEYVITVNGTPLAVIISAAEYEGWKETLDIASDPQLMDAIRTGEREIKEEKGLPWDNVKKELLEENV